MTETEFKYIFENIANGGGIPQYEDNIVSLTNAVKENSIDKKFLKNSDMDILVSKFFKHLSRTINSEADLQIDFIKALLANKYEFSKRYDDICGFQNRFTRGNIFYGIESDPFENTVRVLKLLDTDRKLSRLVLGDSEGYSYPLKSAIENLNFGFAESLISAGYRFEKSNSMKSSPLKKIILQSDDSVIKDALDKCKKFDIPFEVKDKDGNTLLHIAILEQKNIYVIKILVEEFGLDPTIKNNEGKTASDLAITSSLVLRQYLRNVRR